MKKLIIHKGQVLAQDQQAELGLTLRSSDSRAHDLHLLIPSIVQGSGFMFRLCYSLAVCLFASFSTSLVLESRFAVCEPQAEVPIVQMDGLYDKG